MATPQYLPLYNATPAQAPSDQQPAFTTFEYQDGNTAGLAGPPVASDGVSKGAIAGIVIGCILGGILIGALAALCILKRRRLFPKKYGPPKHPDEAAPVHAIDIIRTGSKLDTMNKSQLVSIKSFTHHPGTMPAGGTLADGKTVNH